MKYNFHEILSAYYDVYGKSVPMAEFVSKVLPSIRETSIDLIIDKIHNLYLATRCL